MNALSATVPPVLAASRMVDSLSIRPQEPFSRHCSGNSVP
jgi:hypothetical protein